MITSAQPYSFTSYTETASVYNVTVVSSNMEAGDKNLLMRINRLRQSPERISLVERSDAALKCYRVRVKGV